MKCPQCSKSVTEADGLVTYLTNSHGISRIKVRKRTLDKSQSAKSSDSTTPPSSQNDDASVDSDREKMLERFRQRYHAFGRTPTPAEVDRFKGYNLQSYLDQFGSVYGTAILAELTGVDPERYNHQTNGAQQYSE